MSRVVCILRVNDRGRCGGGGIVEMGGDILAEVKGMTVQWVFVRWVFVQELCVRGLYVRELYIR